MIGSSVHIHLKKLEYSLGDFSTLNQEWSPPSNEINFSIYFLFSTVVNLGSL
jgi:hypothetical protein